MGAQFAKKFRGNGKTTGAKSFLLLWLIWDFFLALEVLRLYLAAMNILALNAGSTSLKFGLFDTEAEEPLLAGDIDWANGERQRAILNRRVRGGQTERRYVSVPTDAAAAGCALQAVSMAADHSKRAHTIEAVGHRVVHGGADFRASVRIDASVKSAIARLGQLAPLHNPPALRAIEAVEAALPEVPQVAVFDTAFYASLPDKACFYPLPYEWHTDWGIRRFGFHGLSHAYCAARAAEFLRRDPASVRLVSCHLGGGCSATAVRGGVAVATTMGFSPLEGLMMGTRSGSVDPGLLIYLQRECGLTLEQLDRALNHSSGLLGVSGLSPDLACIEAARENERARLAFDMFVERVRHAIGALAPTLVAWMRWSSPTARAWVPLRCGRRCAMGWSFWGFASTRTATLHRCPMRTWPAKSHPPGFWCYKRGKNGWWFGKRGGC